MGRSSIRQKLNSVEVSTGQGRAGQAPTSADSAFVLARSDAGKSDELLWTEE